LRSASPDYGRLAGSGQGARSGAARSRAPLTDPVAGTQPAPNAGDISLATIASWFLCGATQFEACGSLDTAERGRKKWISKSAARGNAGRLTIAKNHAARSATAENHAVPSTMAESHAVHSRTAESGRCGGPRLAARRRSCSARWTRPLPRSACRPARCQTGAINSVSTRRSRWCARSVPEHRTARPGAVSADAHPPPPIRPHLIARRATPLVRPERVGAGRRAPVGSVHQRPMSGRAEHSSC
jgi:hypothetical protein